MTFNIEPSIFYKRLVPRQYNQVLLSPSAHIYIDFLYLIAYYYIINQKEEIRMKKAANMDGALEYLIQLIDDGYEYPDAQYKASQKFKVSAEELQERYDDQCGCE
ncbi:hypothetical protein D3C80_19620 [compost metagenome]